MKDGRISGVRGRDVDRVTHGRLGPKGLFSWQANNARDRLTQPLVREGGELVESDWDTAVERIVARTRELLAEKGPQSIGFYNSGQLFLEDYYTLAIMAKAGIGTPHVDGSTRLCTATAGQSLKESFGCDGQPGSYADVDQTDALFLYGHNVAETQTVLWARMRDRLEGSDPPALVVVDPRPTIPALRAGVHLAVRKRHQPRTHERVGARGDRERLGRRGLRRRARCRLRQAGRADGELHPGVGCGHL